MKSKILDTNILIRFFTQDDEKQAKEVDEIFSKAKKGELEISEFILCEIVWVLLSVYELEKEEVVEKIEGILGFEKFKINRNLIRETLNFYRGNNISFVDAMILAHAKIEDKELLSFDNKLMKLV